MTEETGSSGPLPITDRQLRWVYLAGIALNILALLIAATTGETLGALTLVVIIVYLSFRYRMLDAS
jgi:hypothetical protein